jgi:hypothetical protein
MTWVPPKERQCIVKVHVVMQAQGRGMQRATTRFQNTNEDVGSTAERPDSPIDFIDGYDCFEVDRDIGMLKDTNAEEATWEPLSSIYMDAPVVVKRYLKGLPSK